MLRIYSGASWTQAGSLGWILVAGGNLWVNVNFINQTSHKAERVIGEDLRIISSGIHWQWVLARCSTWKADFNYTGNTVFDSFPWPQSPTPPQLEAVAKEAVALRQLRREVMARMGWSLRDLYRTLDDPGANPLREAHARLDAAVRAAYAMPKDADILAFLLELNQQCAAREAAGHPITPPGLPLLPEEHGAFVTEDCIRA